MEVDGENAQAEEVELALDDDEEHPIIYGGYDVTLWSEDDIQVYCFVREFINDGLCFRWVSIQDMWFPVPPSYKGSLYRYNPLLHRRHPFFVQGTFLHPTETIVFPTTREGAVAPWIMEDDRGYQVVGYTKPRNWDSIVAHKEAEGTAGALAPRLRQPVNYEARAAAGPAAVPVLAVPAAGPAKAAQPKPQQQPRQQSYKDRTARRQHLQAEGQRPWQRQQ